MNDKSCMVGSKLQKSTKIKAMRTEKFKNCFLAFIINTGINTLKVVAPCLTMWN